MFLTRVLRKFFGSPENSEVVTVSLGAGCAFTLPVEHAIKLHDAIAIQIIRVQDLNDHGINTTRVTNGDMG
jgi:hypothetical protein